MKGDVEYAGHTSTMKDERRQFAFASNISAIAAIGFSIAIITAGTIFCVHIMQKVDRMQVSQVNVTYTMYNSACTIVLNFANAN